MFNYSFIFSHLYLLNITLLLLWYGIYKKHKLSINLAEHFGFISIFILGVTLILEFFVLYSFNFVSIATSSITFFLASPVASLVNLTTILIALFVIYVSIPVERSAKLLDLTLETNILRLLIVFALITLSVTNNLVVIFFLLEVYSLSSYILVGKNSRLSVFSGEAALKYFFTSSVFSILMIFSISMIYSSTGLVDIKDLQLLLNDYYSWSFTPQVYLASTFLLISIFFKLSAAPFHFWSPDTYEGAPTTIMFFLSVVPKIVLFYLLIKLNFLFYSLWVLLILSAILSTYIGSVMGVYQTKFKRLLAYSMISNTGLMVGVLAWSSNVVINSYFFVYLFIYTLTLVGLFSIFLTNKSRATNLTFKNLFSLVNLNEINPTKFVLLTAMIFTSAGIPSSIGFLVKFLLLFSYTTNTASLLGIIFILLILTVLSVFYYIRLVKIMSFIKKRFWVFYITPSFGVSVVIVSVFVLSLVFLFTASSLYDLVLLIFTITDQ